MSALRSADTTSCVGEATRSDASDSPDAPGIAYKREPMREGELAQWQDHLKALASTLGDLGSAGRGLELLGEGMARKISAGPDLFRKPAVEAVSHRRRSDLAQAARASRQAAGPGMLRPAKEQSPRPPQEGPSPKSRKARPCPVPADVITAAAPMEQNEVSEDIPEEVIEEGPEKVTVPSTTGHRLAYGGACISTIDAHEGAVNCVVGLGNGLVASGGDDMLVKIWHASSSKLVHSLSGHNDAVYCLADIAPAGRQELLASGSDRTSFSLLCAAVLPHSLCCRSVALHLSGTRSIAPLGPCRSWRNDRRVML